MTELMTRPTIVPPRLWSPASHTGKSLRRSLADLLPASVTRRVPALVLPLIPIAVFLVAWHLLTANNVVAWLRFNRMPTPEAVMQTLLSRVSSGSYYDDLLASLQRILLGFGLAAIVGIGLGVLVGRSEIARMALRPFIEKASSSVCVLPTKRAPASRRRWTVGAVSPLIPDMARICGLPPPVG